MENLRRELSKLLQMIVQSYYNVEKFYGLCDFPYSLDNEEQMFSLCVQDIYSLENLPELVIDEQLSNVNSYYQVPLDENYQEDWGQVIDAKPYVDAIAELLTNWGVRFHYARTLLLANNYGGKSPDNVEKAY